MASNTSATSSSIISGKENDHFSNPVDIKQHKHVDTSGNIKDALNTAGPTKEGPPASASRTFSLTQSSYPLQHKEQLPSNENSNHRQQDLASHGLNKQLSPIQTYPNSSNGRGATGSSNSTLKKQIFSSSKRSPLMDIVQTPQTRSAITHRANANSDYRPPKSVSSSQRKQQQQQQQRIGPCNGLLYSTSAAIPSPLVPMNMTSSGSSSSAKKNKTSPFLLDKSRRKQTAVLPSPPTSSSAGRTPELPKSSSLLQSYDNAARTNQQQQRVLLYGETMESLFCINDLSNDDDDDDDDVADTFNIPGISSSISADEIKTLARSIVDGERTDDPSAWRRVLQLVLKDYEHRQGYHQLQKGQSENADADILRLHRRATHCFPLDEESLSSDDQEASRTDDILHIWLSFARTQEIVGSIVEARRTYRFVENQKLLRSKAVLYLQLAEFEKRQKDPTNGEDFRNVLRRGIQVKAEPIQDLEKELKRYEMIRPVTDDGTNHATFEIAPLSRVRFAASEGGSNGIEKSPKRKRRQLLPINQTPKRQKSGEGSSLDRLPSTNGNDKTPSFKIQSSADPSDKSYEATGEKLRKASPRVSFDRTTASTKYRKLYKNVDSSHENKGVAKRPSLTSRLSCKGLSGKAKRVDAEQSFLSLASDDESDDDDQDNDQTSNATGKINNGQLPLCSMTEKKISDIVGKDKKLLVPRFNKTDLSYMWDWDPNERLKKKEDSTTEDTSSAASGDSSHASNDTTHHTQYVKEIDEEKKNKLGQVEVQKPVVATGDAKGEADQAKSSVRTTPSILSEESSKETQTKSSEESNDITRTKKESADQKTRITEKEKEIRMKKMAMMDKANFEFLPLVHQDNILRVNGSSYAKLGLIGKGGSSKVYRALSKKCHVVSIKKVKLDGMEKRAIEGYANEIALLKRLKGNPAIIQMYDSEVDLKRKSLFVVMELGEADLNFVLKQQRASSGKLTLNFIRLTWQQMLNAVHCIHEERIIHSDLKPANFLFVRGALKLIDFGIAKAITNDNTTNIYRETVNGTVNYMSPEAIMDTGSEEGGPRKKIGRASDVWSLGCILYEMVYGRTPFAKLHLIQKFQAITNPNYAIEFPGGDEAAVDAIKLCLHRDAGERPPIVGTGGLLNEHWFLHFNRKPREPMSSSSKPSLSASS